MGVRLCVCGLVGGRGRWLGPTRDTRAAARTTTPANTGLGPDLGRAGADWVPPPALFYVGSALLGSTFSVGLATMETFISKKVTQYADVVGDNVGKLMGVFYMALSAGRFAGPMIIGSITYIATPSGELGEGGWSPGLCNRAWQSRRPGTTARCLASRGAWEDRVRRPPPLAMVTDPFPLCNPPSLLPLCRRADGVHHRLVCGPTGRPHLRRPAWRAVRHHRQRLLVRRYRDGVGQAA